MLKRENQSEKHLVLGSLEILGKIDGPDFMQVRKKIDALANAQQTAMAEIQKYWIDIAQDDVVTAEEKKILKKEWNQIEQVYAALKDDVEGGFLESTQEWKDYKKSYEDLKVYLFETIKLFNNMSADTAIPDTDAFINYYEAYYSTQQLMQNAIINGKVDKLDKKVFKYLADIAKDSVVSALEKKTLKKEWEKIDQVYGAILEEVGTGYLSETDAWKDYKKSYEDLKVYLFETLKLFDDMTADTPVSDTDKFLAVYKAYYLQEQEMQSAIGTAFLKEAIKDNVLSPMEKKTLYKEWKMIQETYDVIKNEVSDTFLEKTQEWKSYSAAYESLKKFLSDLEIFRDLSSNTALSETDTFLAYYENYYQALQNMQNIISNGYWSEIIKDSIVSAFEKKTLKKEWEEIQQIYEAIKADVTASSLTELEDWIVFKGSYENLKQYIESIELFDDMTVDTKLEDSQKFLELYKKYYTHQQQLQTALVNKKNEELAATMPPYTGHYRGVYYTWNEIKNDMEEQILRPEDWIMWGGYGDESISQPIGQGIYQNVTFTKSMLYRLDKAGTYLVWSQLNPESMDDEGYPLYSGEYMAGLTDILKSQKAGPGYFSTVFANVFFANAASITALQTKTINLQADGGMFRTSDYTAGGPDGFRMMSSAWAVIQGIEYPIEFFGNTHIGGNLLIDGASEIRGNALFNGRINCGKLVIDNFPLITTIIKAEKNKKSSILSTQFRQFALSQDTTYNLLQKWGENTNGVYNSREFFSFQYHIEVYSSAQRMTVKLDYGEGLVEAFRVDIWTNLIEEGEPYVEPMPAEFKITKSSGEALAMKIFQIPETKPDDTNFVYVENGFLKLS